MDEEHAISKYPTSTIKKMQVAMYIDFKRAKDKGIKFFKNPSGTIKSLGNVNCVIPPCFFLAYRPVCAQKTATNIHTNPTNTNDDIRSLQQDDPDIGPIVKAIKFSQTRPSWRTFEPASRATKSYWSQWDMLEMQNDILYRTFKSAGNSVYYQVVLPRKCQTEILVSAHDSRFGGGHLGVAKTLRKVRMHYYSYNQREDVKLWVKCCSDCGAKRNPQKRHKAPLQSMSASFPMHRIAIDVCGPFPITESGNKYILVAQDYFTKWVEAYAIADQESQTLARKLVEEFFSCFGVPLVIHSDQGKNFCSTIFQNLCNIIGTCKTRTSAYHPEGDGMVERFNRTL